MGENDRDNPAPTKLTIQDLPNEMLLKILKWIVDEQDLESVQQVCPLWYAVIDECIGRAVTWTSDGLIYFKNILELEREEPELGVSDVGIRKLIVLAHEPSTFPPLKFPHLLKSLDLEGASHPDIFSNLVKGTATAPSNLTTFRFTHVALKHIKSEELEQLHLRFPKLKTMIGGWEWFNGSDSLPNLNVLFRDNHFPQLNHLAIDFPLKSVTDSETLELLLRFVQAHQSLTRLYMTATSSQQFTPSERSTSPTKLEGLITQLRSIPYHGSLQVLGMKAKDICLYPRESNPQLDALKRLLLWPSSLQELQLEMGLISNEILKAVSSRNGATLKKVMINQITKSPVEQLDLGVFSSLQHPQILSPHGFQELTGAKELPPNLECLDLRGPMRCQEIDHILLHLPNLLLVSLRYIDNEEEGFGIKLSTIKEFVQNRRVKKLRVVSNLLSVIQNLPSYEGIPNGDPTNPVSLTCSDRVFEVRLGAAGYYVQQS